MEKRIGTITVFVGTQGNTTQVNALLSTFSHLIVGRQGIPFKDKGMAVICLIIEGLADDINQLSGKLGKLSDIEVRTTLSKTIFEENNESK